MTTAREHGLEAAHPARKPSESEQLRVLSLFAGIGGLELGLERAGMVVVAQSEIDPYACRVLKKHWPRIPNLGDVTQIDWTPGSDARHITRNVNVIALGFPCQSLSRAGRREGVVDGSKSGLWSEGERAIRALRPRYVIVENVTTLRTRGLGRVLGDLAALGYDAEWECLHAAAFSGPHIRDRIFVVAYPGSGRHRAQDDAVFARRSSSQLRPRWSPEPDVRRVDARAANGVDRRRVIGNSVNVPIAEYIGRLIVAHHTQEVAA